MTRNPSIPVNPPLASRSADFSALVAIGVTPRECEVLGWVADEKCAADIARILGVAQKTEGNHVEHLRAKLHAENRTAAASIAREPMPQLRASADRRRET